jgi:probable HAF family extracellular repeat protein
MRFAIARAFLSVVLPLVSAGLTSASAYAGPPVPYSISDLGTLGGTHSVAYAINERGEVVGGSGLRGDTATHSFLYRNRVMADIAPLNSGDVQTAGPTSINSDGVIASGVVVGGIYFPALLDSASGGITVLGSLGGITGGTFNGVATAVNERGEAAGYSYVDTTYAHAFVYRHGVLMDIGALGSGSSYATGMNDTGTVVGGSSDEPFGVEHPFIYVDGVMIEINPFNGPNNEGVAEAINNRGQAVGGALSADGTAFRGFVYADERARDLGVLPGGRNSWALNINDPGQIVGIADRPYVARCWDSRRRAYVRCIQYSQVAFLYQDGRMYDLNRLVPSNSGWVLEWAFGINDRGQIVGSGTYRGRTRAFLLTPRWLQRR